MLNNQSIARVDCVSYLGVVMDNRMDFKSHYNHIVNRANSTLGFIIRWSKEFCDPYITKHLFITYVRPILEYSSQVWSPYRDIDISRIESVQKKFLRFALRNLPWIDAIRLPPYS